MKFVISDIQEGEELYWSNVYGWLDCLDEATVFDTYERDKLRLPVGTDPSWTRVKIRKLVPVYYTTKET